MKTIQQYAIAEGIRLREAYRRRDRGEIETVVEDAIIPRKTKQIFVKE